MALTMVAVDLVVMAGYTGLAARTAPMYHAAEDLAEAWWTRLCGDHQGAGIMEAAKRAPPRPGAPRWAAGIELPFENLDEQASTWHQLPATSSPAR